MISFTLYMVLLQREEGRGRNEYTLTLAQIVQMELYLDTASSQSSLLPEGSVTKIFPICFEK